MLTFNSRQNIFDTSSYQDWFNMKSKNYLVMFLLAAIFSSATSQRETFCKSYYKDKFIIKFLIIVKFSAKASKIAR